MLLLLLLLQKVELLLLLSVRNTWRCRSCWECVVAQPLMGRSGDECAAQPLLLLLLLREMAVDNRVLGL